MRKSIHTRLTITFVGLAIVPLLLVGGIIAWRTFLVQRRQALDIQPLTNLSRMVYNSV
jgi:hypothetical protein